MNAQNYKTLVKKYFLGTAVLCFLLVLALASASYLVDPFQFYHRSTTENAPLSGNMRAQAAGILNTFDIDSIILGTSMLENTSASEASAKLGGKFFNISISGGDYAERAVILKRALRDKPKNVLYSLDRYYINCPHRTDSLPAYLYDDNHLNDIRFYATLPSIKNLFKHNKGLTQTDHDRPNAWFHIPEHSDRFGGIGQWVANRENPQVKDFLLQALPDAVRSFGTESRTVAHSPEKEQLAKEYVDRNILDVIKDHGDTNFYFIFPPYSRFLYANMRRNNPQDFFLHQEVVRYLVDRTKGSRNVHLYGFEDQDFLDDLANYKDLSHYHHKFNSMFLDAIATGRHELTPENVEAYLRRCEQKAWDYDIPALNDEVQRLLETAAKKEEG